MQKLIEYLETSGTSQDAFGVRLGVSQSAVAQWCRGTTRIKAELVLRAAAETSWHVTPHDWRPDLYPHPEDGMPRGEAPPAIALEAPA